MPSSLHPGSELSEAVRLRRSAYSASALAFSDASGTSGQSFSAEMCSVVRSRAPAVHTGQCLLQAMHLPPWHTLPSLDGAACSRRRLCTWTASTVSGKQMHVHAHTREEFGCSASEDRQMSREPECRGGGRPSANRAGARRHPHALLAGGRTAFGTEGPDRPCVGVGAGSLGVRCATSRTANDLDSAAPDLNAVERAVRDSPRGSGTAALLEWIKSELNTGRADQVIEAIKPHRRPAGRRR